MAQPQQTWKEYAGREQGPDDYRFGDILRHIWQKLLQPSRPPGVDEHDMALLDLKVQRDQLFGHRRRFEAMLERDEAAARDCIRQSRKTQAMLALRKKKMHDQLLNECLSHLARIDELIENIEITRIQQQSIQALAAGVATMKKMQKETGGVDYINQLMDDRQEAIEAQRELNEALAGAGVGTDDADALAEYARLEEALAREKLGPGHGGSAGVGRTEAGRPEPALPAGAPAMPAGPTLAVPA
mmetsp:Transcript_90168/g.209783  ORF Transcript_90168/g.209783 Transcript_90168/m.209783 type:complete len:243 (+) Transcript_90168:43-771(+)